MTGSLGALQQLDGEIKRFLIRLGELPVDSDDPAVIEAIHAAVDAAEESLRGCSRARSAVKSRLLEDFDEEIDRLSDPLASLVD